jgi:pimeloyl-ACP methyl ester carboxylesterase
VIPFDRARMGRSSGRVPDTISDMAAHALAFLDGLGIRTYDLLRFSLGGIYGSSRWRENVFQSSI